MAAHSTFVRVSGWCPPAVGDHELDASRHVYVSCESDYRTWCRRLYQQQSRKVESSTHLPPFRLRMRMDKYISRWLIACRCRQCELCLTCWCESC